MNKILEKKYFKFYNTIDRYINIDIPYFEIKQVINDIIFRKYFIVDIRNLTDEEVKNIFLNFITFQNKFLGEEYFKNADYSCNMMLYFLCNDNKKIDKFVINTINNNMSYAYKDFIVESDLARVLNNSEDIELKEINSNFSYNGKDFTLGRFNLINGINGSGKTRMLNEISRFYETPIFNMGTSDFYFDKLNMAIQYCIDNKIMLLLDDMVWKSLNDRDIIKTIDILFNYSKKYNTKTVITSSDNKATNLIKKRVYKPNIIEL